MREPDIAAIAAGLTKAQRERILTAPHDDWFQIAWEGWVGLIWSLQCKGLTYPREPGLQVLSPLGQSVAKFIQDSGR